MDVIKSVMHDHTRTNNEIAGIRNIIDNVPDNMLTFHWKCVYFAVDKILLYGMMKSWHMTYHIIHQSIVIHFD